MVIKIQKKLSRTNKEYVSLWFDNRLVTFDRRLIYKLVDKKDVVSLEVGDCINIPIAGDFYKSREYKE